MFKDGLFVEFVRLEDGAAVPVFTNMTAEPLPTDNMVRIEKKYFLFNHFVLPPYLLKGPSHLLHGSTSAVLRLLFRHKRNYATLQTLLLRSAIELFKIYTLI